MRMWLINPEMMCKQHLLGEHLECHMFVGSIHKNIKLDGYFRNKLLCVYKLKDRHDELAKEMIKRGINHKSELKDFKWKGEDGVIDYEYNIKDLSNRCNKCKGRINEIRSK